MAESSARSLQDPPGSAPDENEFPFGYPTSICEDAPGQKFLCSSCHNILRKALQTLCGHRYCSACLSWIVRNNKNAICQKCKEEDPNTLGEESLLAEERAFGDAAINKEISELRVHCVTLGCSWSGIMKDFEEHQSLCEYALIPCHTGCGHVVMRRKLADHLENGCVNNVTVCQQCHCSLASSECQEHSCEGSLGKEKKPVQTETASKEKSHSTSSSSKEGCCFSEVGCAFRGSKEKIQEHEKSAVGAHMLLLLQHMRQLQGTLCSKGFTPRPELSLKSAGKGTSELQMPAGLGFSRDPEVDCFPGSSVPEDESVLQQLVREKVISELENKLHVFENIVAVLNKEVESSNLEILAFRRQSELDQNIIRSLELKIAELHRCLTQKDAGLSSLHKSLLFSEQASYDGIFLWKITEVGRKLQDSVTGRTVSLYSPAFYTGFLSMQYNFKVYGIDSSSSNTNGAHERNRKLKKHWRAYQSRGKESLKRQSLEMANDKPVENETNCKTINKELLNNASSLPNQSQVIIQDLVPSCGFTETATFKTNTETEADLVTGTQSHETKLSEEVLAILNVLPVDAVEDFSSSHCNCGELCEEEKVQRKTTSLKTKARKSSESNLYFPLTSCITAETELTDIITDLEDCMMVGLHTCGDLAANTLRIFTAKPEIKAVCSVGCCYHLLSEQFENQEECHDQVWGFPMCQYLKDKGWCCGRNARMSACLALERVAVGQMLPTESLFYRAVLQVIIEEIYGVTKSDRHVGKTFSKSSSFIDYVRRSLKKLELDDSKLPDSCIMDYYEKYKHRMNELEAFNMLKVVLAPCIEVLILLDRLCYLKEQENIAWSGLVKLFDPVKSPRCYAVIALKNQ